MSDNGLYYKDGNNVWYYKDKDKITENKMDLDIDDNTQVIHTNKFHEALTKNTTKTTFGELEYGNEFKIANGGGKKRSKKSQKRGKKSRKRSKKARRSRRRYSRK